MNMENLFNKQLIKTAGLLLTNLDIKEKRSFGFMAIIVKTIEKHFCGYTII